MDDCREAFREWTSTGLINEHDMQLLWMAWQAAWQQARTQQPDTQPAVSLIDEILKYAEPANNYVLEGNLNVVSVEEIKTVLDSLKAQGVEIRYD